MFVPAKLDSSQLKALQEFEYSENVRVLALTEARVEPAAMAADKLAALKDLEARLGVCLLAVQ